jgi:oligopeptide/dipeptide ABC transporter ATP-binding protein
MTTTHHNSQDRADRALDSAFWHVDRLSVVYQSEDGTRLEAVSDLSFELKSGQVLAIVGESGSGKSTVVSAITGLLAENGLISGGSIVTSEGDLATLSEQEMCDLRGALFGYLPQQPMAAMNPTMTVGRQIAESAMIHTGIRYKEGRAKAIDLMRSLGLRDPELLVDQFPHQLSGGMLQRVLLAAALINDPDTLIADEPTSAVDASSKWQIVELIGDLARERGLSVLLVTHDISVVERAADEIAVMYGGRLVEHGPTKTVIDSPQHPYTSGLLGSRVSETTPHQSLLNEIPGIPIDLPTLALTPGCPFAARCDRAVEDCHDVFPQTKRSHGRMVACHNPLELRHA